MTPTPNVWKQIVDALKDYNNLRELKDTEDRIKYINAAPKTSTTVAPMHMTSRKIRHAENNMFENNIYDFIFEIINISEITFCVCICS